MTSNAAAPVAVAAEATVTAAASTIDAAGRLPMQRPPFEGSLNKFTNVMKGWQFRWFVLSSEEGRIDYYLPEERGGRPRGGQHLAGTIVVPSEEDSTTFNVNFASGDVYKLRAATVKDRQMWVDRIRMVAQLHDRAIAQNAPPLASRESGMLPTPPGSRSQIMSNGEPSEALQHLSLSVLDAFGSVHDIVHQSEVKNEELCRTIERLPGIAVDSATDNSCPPPGPRALDEDLLVLKATSHAALFSVEQALSILQDYRELKRGPIVMTTSGKTPKTSFAGLASPMTNSPKKSSAPAAPPPPPPSGSSFLSTTSASNAAANSASPAVSPTKSVTSSSLRLQSAAAVSSSTTSLPVSSAAAAASS